MEEKISLFVTSSPSSTTTSFFFHLSSSELELELEQNAKTILSCLLPPNSYLDCRIPTAVEDLASFHGTDGGHGSNRRSEMRKTRAEKQRERERERERESPTRDRDRETERKSPTKENLWKYVYI